MNATGIAESDGAPGATRRTDPEAIAAQALAGGDVRAALTALMEAYGDDMFRHCRQVMGDVALAEDVHQTVFVQAYRDLGTYSGSASLRTWLYAICRNRCLDALKARRRFGRRIALSPQVPERPDRATAPDERIDDRKRLAALERCLGKLRPGARIAVLLRYREGLTYEEMAIVCDARPAALQARVARAVTKLRKWLEASDAL